MAGGPASLAPRGVSIPSGAGGGRAASPPSLISRGRLLKGQNKRSGTKASGDTAPGRGPREAAGRARPRGGEGRCPEGEFEEAPGKAKRAVELLGPALSHGPRCCPGGPEPRAAPQQGGASGRAPCASPPSHPQPREKNSARGALAARQHPPGVHGFRGPRTPTLARGPRRATRGGAARQGAGAKSPGGSPEVLPPPPEVAAPQSLAPQRSGSGWSSGWALHYVIFERGRQTARSAVVFATVNPGCAEIS